MQGGFVTGCVASISYDGKLTFANAGHLPPYVNGKEIALESGLPLGLAADATYPEATLNLQLNVQLTLLTDGVAEARNASGELFGFDRTLKLSNRSSNEIAQAAIDFGQEDDITVLTLKRQPGVEQVPAELEVQAASRRRSAADAWPHLSKRN